MINVTCAIIKNEENEVLVVQRGKKSDHPFKWEFPGGKINEGETEEDCIIREIREELFMDIVIRSRLRPVSHDYGNKKILLIPFICDTLDELPVLTEHNDFRWCIPEELKSVDFEEADLLVLDQYLGNICNLQSERVVENTNDIDPITEKEIQKMIYSMTGTQEADWLAATAPDNPSLVLKLLDYSYSEDKKFSFCASWTLSKIFDKNPEIIAPFIPGMIEKLNSLNNDSVQRSFLKIISIIDITQMSLKHHGILVDYCFKALNSGVSAVAIKAYSMEILYKLALLYPELANELSASINILSGEASAGIIARGKIILGKLMKLT